MSVSFSPDGEILASASEDGTVKLWDRSGRQLQTLEGHTDEVWNVSFSPDGETLASASHDGAVKLWNFNLDDLMAKSCNWLQDYMTYGNASDEEKALCADELNLSSNSTIPESTNWFMSTRAFFSQLFTGS
ncbi:MAG: hypothetical protein AAF215_18780 [Cyanobacteria bacterium P01_A01_bin.123]